MQANCNFDSIKKPTYSFASSVEKNEFHSFTNNMPLLEIPTTTTKLSICGNKTEVSCSLPILKTLFITGSGNRFTEKVGEVQVDHLIITGNNNIFSKNCKITAKKIDDHGIGNKFFGQIVQS